MLVRPDILVVSLVTHILALALPLALLQIYDRILPSQSYGTAAFLVIGVGIAILLESVLRYGRQAIFVGIGSRYEAHTTMAALDRLQHADISEVEKRGTAAISDALRAIGQVRDFWSGQAGAALYELPFVAVYIGLIAYIGGWLALIPLALFILALSFALFWNPRIETAASELEKVERQRHDFAWSLFNALGYLKAVGSERSLGALWRRLNKRQVQQSAVLETRLGWVRENATGIGQLSTMLIVTFGAIEVINGQLTTGALAACTMLAGRSIGPAMASLGYWSQLARISEAQKKVDDLTNLPLNTAFGGSSDSQAKQEMRGEITIEAPELLNAPVTIAAGEVVHLRSLNAPHASRLMTAISGMTDDPGIKIKIDGKELSEFGRREYRDDVMLVSRHLALVPGSILNNLTLYDPRYNAEVRNYSEALGLQSHVDKLKNGVLTEVGPGTAEHLDEGVYQRIAIIRALLRKPKILLLDHAATGLDLDGIKRLAAMLNSLQGNTTVLVSTYKETLIEACSRSLVLGDKGAAE
ncbi:ABC transporter transmembrane domain-containing protein [Marinobacterium sp. YM272]|uniref:ABC transporter transmembrane domain-containing protein n=1 Tax=Marinobacterium sp. YM272 TaxID=3421654 RepID=UPI003D7FD037